MVKVAVADHVVQVLISREDEMADVLHHLEDQQRWRVNRCGLA
jgi:hypothetical protein